MKILALVFFLFGIAASIPLQDLERAKDEAVLNFFLGMEQAPSLREAVDLDLEELDEVEDGIKTELGKKFKEALESILQKIKDALEHGKTVKEEWKEKVEKIKEHLRDLHKDIGKKAKELLERIIEKTKGKVKEWIEKIFVKKSSGEVYAADSSGWLEKFRDFLKNLREGEARKDIQKHFDDLVNWLEKTFKNVTEAGKGRIEKMRKVVSEFIQHMKKVGKQTAHDVLEFFRPYREDLGTLWDQLEKAVKDAYGKHGKSH